MYGSLQKREPNMSATYGGRKNRAYREIKYMNDVVKDIFF